MTTLLGFATIILILLIVFQLARTSEMLKALRGEAPGSISDSSNRTQGLLLMAFMILGIIGSVAGWFWFKDKSLILNWVASEHGQKIDDMFLLTSVICGIVFYITQALLFYFAYKYRARKGHTAEHYSHDNKLEVIWTVIPAIVLTILVAKGIQTWYEITEAPPEDKMTVEVTAEQFMWTARYAGADSTYGDRNYRLTTKTNILGQDWEDEANHDDIVPAEIHIVVDKPVEFKLRAKDVLHSFYLPHFRLKMDCVPGIPTRFWMTPIMTTAEIRDSLKDENFNYVLACAELCGSGHSGMRFNVIVETQEEFDAWMAEQTPFYEVLGLDKAKEKEAPAPTAALNEVEAPTTPMDVDSTAVHDNVGDDHENNGH